MSRFNPKLLTFPYSRLMAYAVALAIILPLAFRAYEQTLPYNGFDLSDVTVPVHKIEAGGPGRDAIPALTDPAVVSVDRARYQDEQRVLGVVLANEARAYPEVILNWHEVVNDRLGGKPIMVAWCPLCGTGVAFHAMRDGQRLDFGVSGLLYMGNLLMYDRDTRSLWSQLSGQAISGERMGEHLTPLPVIHTTWGRWRKQYPQSTVLMPETGYNRDYTQDPYAGYHGAFQAMTDDGSGVVSNEWVIGLRSGDLAKAYPLSVLAKTANTGVLRDSLGGKPVIIRYDVIETTFDARWAVDDQPLSSTLSYWAVWHTFFPDSQIYHAEAPDEQH